MPFDIQYYLICHTLLLRYAPFRPGEHKTVTRHKTLCHATLEPLHRFGPCPRNYFVTLRFWSGNSCVTNHRTAADKTKLRHLLIMQKTKKGLNWKIIYLTLIFLQSLYLKNSTELENQTSDFQRWLKYSFSLQCLFIMKTTGDENWHAHQ